MHSSPIKVIHLHKGFFGNCEEDFYVDFKNLNAAEKQALYKWAEDVLNGTVEHLGRNKTSWLDDGMKPLKFGANLYREYQAWHYHCGPRYLASGTHTTANWLPYNVQGHRSMEVVHYSQKQLPPPLGKKSERSITIFGFSRNHVPFVLDNDKGNHFKARMGTPLNVLDASHLFVKPPSDKK